MNNVIKTFSLRFLRELLAPHSSFDAFGKGPVYLNVNGQRFEVSEISYCAGPFASYVEIQAGRELTDREVETTKEPKLIDGYNNECGLCGEPFDSHHDLVGNRPPACNSPASRPGDRFVRAAKQVRG